METEEAKGSIRRASILSTGDELTTGITVDTNSNFISGRLVDAGIEIAAVLTVGDDRGDLRWALEAALDRAELVISTGGLGPTADDLTTEVVAQTFGKGLRFDEGEAERIRSLFRALGRPMPENNLRQAYVPEGAELVPNPRGTATGYRLRADWKGRSSWIVVLPGVPSEMRPMIDESVLPWLQGLDDGRDSLARLSLVTFGASESALDELLEGVVHEREARLSFRAAFPQIDVRLTVRRAVEETPRALEELGKRVRERIGTYVFGEGDATMEGVAVELLRKKEATVTLAESCTGGLVGHRITNVPGSSRVLRGALVPYSSELKESLLGVAPETLATRGAVSEETVREMATGARRVGESTLGLATTGIAGPDGGSEATPVGTVWIGLADERATWSRRYQLWGGRERIKSLASQIALDWLRRWALDGDPSESAALRR